MKIHRNIFFRITFVLAVLFCFGINTYTHCAIPSWSLELSSGTSGTVHGFSSDNDSFNEDEINQAPGTVS
jgi:hypothetical protein